MADESSKGLSANRRKYSVGALMHRELRKQIKEATEYFRLFALSPLDDSSAIPRGVPFRYRKMPHKRSRGSLSNTVSRCNRFFCEPALVLRKKLGKFSRNGHAHYEKSTFTVSSNQIRHQTTDISEKREPAAAVLDRPLN